MRLVGKYAVIGWGSAFVLAAVASCTYDFDRLVAQPGSGATGGGGGSAGASGGASGSGGTAGADDGGDSDGSGGAGTAGTAGKAGSSGSGGSSGGTADAGKDAGGKAGATDASSDRGPDAIADVRAEQAFDCTAVGGTVYQAHCYYPSTAKTNWDTAKTTGCAAPSHLVVITTAGEQNIVAGILAGGDRWIGLKKDLQPNMESSFHWVTGEALSFKTWDTYDTGAPEPNYTGDCVRMSPNNNWGDISCTGPYPAVCEYE